MTHEREELERRISELRAPTPDAGLRDRTLARARRASRAPVSPWDRLWFSLPLRVGVGSLAAALLIASIAEPLVLQRRLERLVTNGVPARGEGFDWIEDELGIDFGARAHMLRTGYGDGRDAALALMNEPP